MSLREAMLGGDPALAQVKPRSEPTWGTRLFGIPESLAELRAVGVEPEPPRKPVDAPPNPGAARAPFLPGSLAKGELKSRLPNPATHQQVKTAGPLLAAAFPTERFCWWLGAVLRTRDGDW